MAKKKWEQIVDELRQDIFSGKYKPGEDFPTNHELMKAYDTHSVTIQQAINSLISEGLLVSAGSSRNRRTVYKPPERSARSCGFLTDAGDGGSQELMDLKILTNPDDIPGEVREKMDAPVLLYRTRQWKNSIPVATSESYIPGSLPLPAIKYMLSDPSYELYALMKAFGYVPATCRESLVATPPTPEEQNLLKIPRQVYCPVVRIKRMIFDPDGELLEYCILADRGDSYEFIYEFPLTVQSADLDGMSTNIEFLCQLLAADLIILTGIDNKPLTPELKQGFISFLRENHHPELYDAEVNFKLTPLAAYREGARGTRPKGINAELSWLLNISHRLNLIGDRYLKTLGTGSNNGGLS